MPYGGDRLVVGATVEEPRLRRRVTAGAVHDLLHDAIEVVPGVSELSSSRRSPASAPARPTTPRCSGPAGLPGLVLATGHYRNGVLLTPVTADARRGAARHRRAARRGRAPFTADRFRR